MNAAHYLKFLLAVAFVTVSGAGAALADGVLSTPEAINLGIQGGGAVLTYVVPNLPAGPGKYLKLFVQGGTAGAVVAQSALSDGIAAGEWLQIGAAVLGVFTVYAIPNYPELVGIGQHEDGSSTAVYVVDGSSPTEAGDVGASPFASVQLADGTEIGGDQLGTLPVDDSTAPPASPRIPPASH